MKGYKVPWRVKEEQQFEKKGNAAVRFRKKGHFPGKCFPKWEFFSVVFCSCVWQSLGIKCRLVLHCGLGNDNLCVCGALVILALEAELTLAVGQEYLQSSENFAVSFNNITPFFSLFFNIFFGSKALSRTICLSISVFESCFEASSLGKVTFILGNHLKKKVLWRFAEEEYYAKIPHGCSFLF